MKPLIRIFIVVTVATVLPAGGICDLLAAGRRASGVPVARDLGTGSLAWETSRAPSVAVSANGTVYVVWPGKGRLGAPRAEGIAMLPEECTFGGGDSKWSGVPGISVRRRGRWSAPGLLVEGRVDCDMLHAWCDGEALHLLVVAERVNKCNHLVLDPKTGKWRVKARLPFAPSQYCARCSVGKSVHIACSEGQYVHYLSFDGAAWSRPLRIEKSRNTSGCVTRVRMAVDRRRVAHLMWWSAGTGEHGTHGYAAVSKGQTVAEAVKFEKSPIEQGEMNLGFVPEGRLFVAYKARVPRTHPGADKIHIRYRKNGKWTKPQLLDAGPGRMHGHIYTAWNANGVFVSWLAGESYGVGGGLASSSVRRCSTMRGGVWSKSKWLARHDRGILGRISGEQTPVSPVSSGICLDGRGYVHMAWGTPGCFHAVVGDLSGDKSKTTTPPGDSSR